MSTSGSRADTAASPSFTSFQKRGPVKEETLGSSPIIPASSEIASNDRNRAKRNAMQMAFLFLCPDKLLSARSADGGDGVVDLDAAPEPAALGDKAQMVGVLLVDIVRG